MTKSLLLKIGIPMLFIFIFFIGPQFVTVATPDLAKHLKEVNIIYSDNYNIRVSTIQDLHMFDTEIYL